MFWKKKRWFSFFSILCYWISKIAFISTPNFIFFSSHNFLPFFLTLFLPLYTIILVLSSARNCSSFPTFPINFPPSISIQMENFRRPPLHFRGFDSFQRLNPDGDVGNDIKIWAFNFYGSPEGSSYAAAWARRRYGWSHTSWANGFF